MDLSTCASQRPSLVERALAGTVLGGAVGVRGRAANLQLQRIHTTEHVLATPSTIARTW